MDGLAEPLAANKPPGVEGGSTPARLAIDLRNVCSYDADMDRHDLERLRRSIVMLQPGQPAGLKREEAMRLLAETQRLQHELADVMMRLRAIVEEGTKK